MHTYIRAYVSLVYIYVYENCTYVYAYMCICVLCDRIKHCLQRQTR